MFLYIVQMLNNLRGGGGEGNNLQFSQNATILKVSSLVFIDSSSRPSIITTFENLVLPVDISPELRPFCGPCCSIMSVSHRENTNVRV